MSTHVEGHVGARGERMWAIVVAALLAVAVAAGLANSSTMIGTPAVPAPNPAPPAPAPAESFRPDGGSTLP